MPNRGVLGVQLAGPDTAHDGLASVGADANLDRRIAGLAQPRRIAPQIVLHLERGEQRAMRMILVRDRRAEQREDSVAGRLHDVAVIAMDRVDHDAQALDRSARAPASGSISSIRSIDPLMSANSAK